MNSIAIVSLLAAVATLTSAAPTGPAGNSAAVFGRSDATVCAPGTGYFQNCSNGFRGCCKADACGSKTGCPDDKPGSVIEPVSTPVNTPPTSNPDGFYFACTGNGFRGYCKSDPCQTWCPDYKFGTYEPVSPVVKPETVTKPAPAPVNPEPVACPPVNAY